MEHFFNTITALSERWMITVQVCSPEDLLRALEGKNMLVIKSGGAKVDSTVGMLIPYRTGTNYLSE